ncbi:MAG TPA: DoxX family protein [Polyangiaceae bacterium]|nr:DoxX family protein [Polyangiaceae bacterium]
MGPPTIITKWQSFEPRLRSLLRIMAGFMFMLAGTTKLFAWPTAGHAGQGGGPVELMSQMGLAGVLESGGGLLLMLGLFTRPVAFIVSGEMAVAYFQAHLPQSFWPTANGGVTAALYCFIWLYFSAAGAGPWSLDAKIRRRG